MPGNRFDDLIDLEKLQRLADEYSSRIKNKVETTQAKLTQERQDHLNQLDELAAQERNKSIQKVSLQQQEAKQRKWVESSTQSLLTQRGKVDELLKKKNELLDTKQGLETEINQLKSVLQSREQELRESNKKIDAQLASVPIQLANYERYLGLKIDTVDARLIQFTFTNIDPNDYDREFSFRLRIGDSFEIDNTTPQLSDEVVKSLQDEFNNNSRFVEGLKKVRNSFRDLV
ncbi:putative kinetochore protein SPC25 [Spathaspora sp. JA1]|nr:putative kinetochore protein SPC25 [Spathaspora sp. JA1]